MGNRVLCGDAGIRCTEHCRQLVPRRDQVLAESDLCDPAGAVFDDTLEALDDIDRQLILFSLSTSVVAVRWLLELGASRQACDTNGTSCLHAACRSGSLGVVEVLLDSWRGEGADAALRAVDVAGWTPLHISVFMGRPDVCGFLLLAKASTDKRNLADQTPLDLCSDARTRSVLSGSISEAIQTSAKYASTRKNLMESFQSVEVRQGEGDDVVIPEAGKIKGEVQFEPFFVPRMSLVPERYGDDAFKRFASKIGRAIFNRQPGRGLSFLVGTGCTRDYPIDLVALLRGDGFDLMKVGTYLGEDFSLSKILRMEFINSISVLHSGVVQCLTKAFANFAAPPDLQKVDRILASIAEVWWRQHQRRNIAKATVKTPGGQNELEGFDLRHALPGAAVLHQIMFSTMMLHQNLHGPLAKTEPVSLERWIELNQCLTTDISPVCLEEVLTPIYHCLSSSRIPNVEMCAPQPSLRSERAALPPALVEFQQVEGWARILGDNLPALFARAADCWQMFSEATASSRRWQAEGTGRQRAGPRPMSAATLPDFGGEANGVRNPFASPALPDSRQTLGSAGRLRRENTSTGRGPPRPAAPHGAPEAVWMTLCSSLLFLSVGPGDGAPFAFVHLGSVQFAGLEPAQNLLALEAGADTGHGRAPLILTFLLPDGRWQTVDVPQLVIEVCDRGQLEAWVLAFSELSSMGPMIEAFTL